MESILNKTWGHSQPSPPEWVDFLLMKRMRWSWAQLQEAPIYVRRYCLDFLNLIGEAEEAEQRKAERRADTDAQRR